MSNGIRQGSLLSPLLFSLYVDKLSIELNNANIGCYIENMSVNHLLYADDMVLMAPSAPALNDLISICCEFAENNDITFSETIQNVCVYRHLVYN